MRKTFYLIFTLCFFALSTYSQGINRLKEGGTVSKGKITTSEGQSDTFRNLTVNDGIFRYKDSKGNTIEKPVSEIYKITKKGNYAGYGAALGGLSSLIGVLQTENQIQNDIQNGLAVDSGNRLPIYLGMTAGFTGLGALVGYFIKKEKTIYINLQAVSFSPSFMLTPENNISPMLTLKINLSNPN